MGQLVDMYHVKAYTKMSQITADSADQGDPSEQFVPEGGRHPEHHAKCKCNQRFDWEAKSAHDKTTRRQRGSAHNFLDECIQ